MTDRSTPGERRDLKRPLPHAVLIALIYGVCAIAYIQISDHIAALFASEVGQLATIQRYKGMAFVLVTCGLLFVFAWRAYRRYHDSAQRLLVTERALLESERRATAGLLSLSVAHDSSNLLQVLDGNAYLLARQRDRLDDEGRKLLDGIQSAIGNLLAIIEQMRMGGRRAALSKPAEVDLATFVSDSLAFLKHHDRLKGCTVSLSPPQDGHRLAVYPAMLHDALVNLVLNAGDAVGGQGTIDVVCRATDGWAEIEVHDNGPGVPQQMRPHLFQAFHTTKAEGTGLGLLAVKTCAELHEGHVEYLDSPKGGACFRLAIRSVAQSASA